MLRTKITEGQGNLPHSSSVLGGCGILVEALSKFTVAGSVLSAALGSAAVPLRAVLAVPAGESSFLLVADAC